MKALQDWIERYFPCPFERGHSALVIVGVSTSLVYVFTRIGFRESLEQLPQNLMVLTFLASIWTQRRKLWSDLVFRLLVLAIVIPWALFAINALIDYESAVKYRSTNDLAKLFLFLPLAWWIGGSREGAVRMLVLAFLGLLTAIALDPNLSTSLAMLAANQRVDFGIYNAQHGAMFFGMVIIFCLGCLAQRARLTPRLNWGNALLLAAGTIALVGLLGTRTRAAFLGLLVAGFVAFLLRLKRGRFFDGSRLSLPKTMLAAVLVFGVLTWPATVLIERLSVETATFQAVLTGDLDQVPFSSFGIRIHSWAEALKWIAERPVTGWGQNARSDVIPLAESFPDEVKAAGFGHLHNGYLELLLGFGIVGFVFVAVLWIVVLRRIQSAASRELFSFAFYSGIFFLVINLSESFFIYSSGEFAMALFMAAGYSQYLAKSLGSNPPINAPSARQST